ncbi:MAG: hypothetical protein IBX50_19625 [Marinospirillum sp.]|uniref:hypothetical protein n=1 Tax=Marinospirillum sp. TaxID=2183934 RepID=UPI0019DEED48|nr:hypothetical protein [Marinospirillum sp.]MBE0508900.1 hypothetical protein [Marinospirillum sp.]
MAGFPDNWPQNCPPIEAEDADGVVYRVCSQNPPSQRDFQSHEELGKRSSGDPCMRRGLSVFRDLAEARHLTVLFPKLGSKVFRGDLSQEQGKVKHTPARQRPSHTTWWPYEGIERAASFKLIEEG